jgi:chromosome segregation protein
MLLETALPEIINPMDLRTQLTEVTTAHKNLESMWTQRLSLERQSVEKTVGNSKEQLAELDSQISHTKTKANHINIEIEEATNDVLDLKISLALLQYRKRNLSKAITKLSQELQTALNDLEEALEKAEKTGPRVVPMKSIMEIIDEIRVTDGHLAALADVSQDIERMYESYSELYLELKKKARMVAENRGKAMEEVQTRMEAWKTVIRNLLSQVNVKYQIILSEAHAIGEVRLVNEHDVEEAGLEIFVGFKGGKPVPLNAYTQSGGERSTATMTFLIALQQHVQSPFRAVDEYDIHMDPKNREIIANLLVSSVKGLNAQYLAITPSQVTFTEKDVHIITVQNVDGTSLIKEVA